MQTDSTLSTWLMRLQGDQNELAAEKLWDRISPRVQDLSRRLLQRFDLPTVIDEDDVTISVFASLCSGLQSQQFPELRDSDSLWKLLILMTVRKVNDHAKIYRAKKRGSGEPLRGKNRLELDQLLDVRPEPSLEAMMNEQCHAMLKDLNDPVLELLVLLKMDGYTNDEIAERLGYSRRTVQRMLNIVRDAWSQYVG